MGTDAVNLNKFLTKRYFNAFIISSEKKKRMKIMVKKSTVNANLMVFCGLILLYIYFMGWFGLIVTGTEVK